jgi:hypothetical protein
MFKQNDYIVTLKIDTNFSTFCARDNWCFKQKSDQSYIQPCMDLSGDTGNGNGNLQFDKSKRLKDWRYATPEEIAEYDRLGKPFDVTTLKPKELSKEELLEEAKRKYPIGSQVKSVFDDLFDTVKEQSHFNYPDAWNGDTPQIWFTGDRYGLLIYDRGKWAEIVSKPESAEKMEEPEFIVGKWYKRTTEPTSSEFVLYIKCSSIDPIKDCEHITFGRKHNVIVNQGRQYKEWKELEDLSEIQQYLPEGHPDKFPVSRELTSEAQQKPQTMVQKWAVGTYVVFLVDYGDNPKGTVDRIGKDFGETIQAATKYIFHDSSSLCNMNKNTEVKWFATQKEAEEFAKTLREPEPVKSSVEPEWTPQVGDWVVILQNDYTDFGCKQIESKCFHDDYFMVNNTPFSYSKGHYRKALPHEIPTERGSGIIEQIESVKDYGVLTEEKLKGFVSDLFYTPSEPSPKVDTALPMISFVTPPREI